MSKGTVCQVAYKPKCYHDIEKYNNKLCNYCYISYYGGRPLDYDTLMNANENDKVVIYDHKREGFTRYYMWLQFDTCIRKNENDITWNCILVIKNAPNYITNMCKEFVTNIKIYCYKESLSNTYTFKYEFLPPSIGFEASLGDKQLSTIPDAVFKYMFTKLNVKVFRMAVFGDKNIELHEVLEN